VLEGTNSAVLREFEARAKTKVNPEPFLLRKAGVGFHSVSSLDFRRLLGDPDHTPENLRAKVQGFSSPVRDSFELAPKDEAQGAWSAFQGVPNGGSRDTRVAQIGPRPVEWPRTSRRGVESADGVRPSGPPSVALPGAPPHPRSGSGVRLQEHTRRD